MELVFQTQGTGSAKSQRWGRAGGTGSVWRSVHGGAIGHGNRKEAGDIGRNVDFI